MQDIIHLLSRSLLALAIILLCYHLWPWLISLLAVIGAVQVHHSWRRHRGRPY